MTPSPEKQCSVVYEGQRYPEFHGTRCALTPSHPEEKHCALVEDKHGAMLHLRWPMVRP